MSDSVAAKDKRDEFFKLSVDQRMELVRGELTRSKFNMTVANYDIALTDLVVAEMIDERLQKTTPDSTPLAPVDIVELPLSSENAEKIIEFDDFLMGLYLIETREQTRLELTDDQIERILLKCPRAHEGNKFFLVENYASDNFLEKLAKGELAELGLRLLTCRGGREWNPSARLNDSLLRELNQLTLREGALGQYAMTLMSLNPQAPVELVKQWSYGNDTTLRNLMLRPDVQVDDDFSVRFYCERLRLLEKALAGSEMGFNLATELHFIDPQHIIDAEHWKALSQNYTGSLKTFKQTILKLKEQ